MKFIFIFLFMMMLFSITTYSQNPDVYAEFYSDSTQKVFMSDSYNIFLYDNAYGLKSIDDSIGVPTNGFQAKLIFIFFNDSLRNVYKNAFTLKDKGIFRCRVWDTKLYGYCYVEEINSYPDCLMVTLIGRKNVANRKKLLFKDSPRLRMWNYPWLGE